MKRAVQIKWICGIGMLLVIMALLYTREVPLGVTGDTEMGIEYNRAVLTLGEEDKVVFEQSLKEMPIYRPLTFPEYGYFTKSTFTIHLQTVGELGYAGASGILTICIDNPNNSSFQGQFPKGKFRISKSSLEKIIQLLEKYAIQDSAD